MTVNKAQHWANELGCPDFWYFIEDAIFLAGPAWDRATIEAQREYLEFLVNFVKD